MTTKPAYTVLGAMFEYNDTDYDLYPTGELVGVFWSLEGAQNRARTVAEELADGWEDGDVSDSIIEEGETLVEAVRRHLTITAVEMPIDEHGCIPADTFALLGLGIPTEAWPGDPGRVTCLGVAQGEEVIELARRKIRSLLVAIEAENPSSMPWLVDAIDDALHTCEITEVLP